METAEGPLLEIYGASFVKSKANYEISEFGKNVSRRHKVGGFRQKGEVSIDEGDGISCKGSCVGRHRDFAEFVVL